MMKYILSILTLMIAIGASAQTDMQHTPKGALYKVFTNSTNARVKDGDIITFQYIQKTDKDSVLYSTYVSGQPGRAQIHPSQNVGDMMEIFPLLTVNDSALVKLPTDSIFKGHEDQRPPFFPKGSNLNFTIKILKAQTVDEFKADLVQAEITGSAKYIADHKLNLQTTPSGLKYVITQASTKPKPVKGDTVYVNYTGKNLDDKVFDSDIEADAKAAGLQQPGRTYEPLQFVIGAGGIIAGWDEGMQLLNEGSKAIFVIPSKLAYGEPGYNGIPPFSTLVFNIELVKVVHAKHVAAAPAKKPAAKKHVYKKKATTTKN
ncbi:FKBP-type peptidyl-prolyl cis-trans isomerase [Mucilaginibacter sp. BJC16-A38]|uniref:FKBP-type peptidyl-prolyl cis-trans isomerase n=1 Tax=Mucilaginibacter phenanthrenivorans TaxID=1234842 RepID=UPI002157D869|nr:FKBP-type peptidyl-prolyl cis-trans isomerase [Mucilaginibacter phenanthrenivorans]MCR8559107.1 FKBP-type peptidyl-prolyl cis-trans isomerase [Mucilaginibacter phenanthrenivorans]